MKPRAHRSTPRVPFDYATVRTTKSRIDKGLLAIPASLVSLFPRSARTITLVNDAGIEESKTFTPLGSSSGECRIGGLAEFYRRNAVRDGDEVVVQLLGDGRFRLTPELAFQAKIRNLEALIEGSGDEAQADKLLGLLAEATNLPRTEVAKNEFVRLAEAAPEPGRKRRAARAEVKAGLPAHLRRILLELYGGACQVSGFTFLTASGAPYFEVHHIDPSVGNHIKNLLVVSPNVHAQFTYASLEQQFDDEGWLRGVRFNRQPFSVFQIIDKLPKRFDKELHA